MRNTPVNFSSRHYIRCCHTQCGRYVYFRTRNADRFIPTCHAHAASYTSAIRKLAYRMRQEGNGVTASASLPPTVSSTPATYRSLSLDVRVGAGLTAPTLADTRPSLPSPLTPAAPTLTSTALQQFRDSFVTASALRQSSPPSSLPPHVSPVTSTSGVAAVLARERALSRAAAVASTMSAKVVKHAANVQSSLSTCRTTLSPVVSLTRAAQQLGAVGSAASPVFAKSPGDEPRSPVASASLAAPPPPRSSLLHTSAPFAGTVLGSVASHFLTSSSASTITTAAPFESLLTSMHLPILDSGAAPALLVAPSDPRLAPLDTASLSVASHSGAAESVREAASFTPSNSATPSATPATLPPASAAVCAILSTSSSSELLATSVPDSGGDASASLCSVTHVSASTVSVLEALPRVAVTSRLFSMPTPPNPWTNRQLAPALYFPPFPPSSPFEPTDAPSSATQRKPVVLRKLPRAECTDLAMRPAAGQSYQSFFSAIPLPEIVGRWFAQTIYASTLAAMVRRENKPYQSPQEVDDFFGFRPSDAEGLPSTDTTVDSLLSIVSLLYYLVEMGRLEDFDGVAGGASNESHVAGLALLQAYGSEPLVNRHCIAWICRSVLLRIFHEYSVQAHVRFAHSVASFEAVFAIWLDFYCPWSLCKTNKALFAAMAFCPRALRPAFCVSPPVSIRTALRILHRSLPRSGASWFTDVEMFKALPAFQDDEIFVEFMLDDGERQIAPMTILHAMELYGVPCMHRGCRVMNCGNCYSYFRQFQKQQLCLDQGLVRPLDAAAARLVDVQPNDDHWPDGAGFTGDSGARDELCWRERNNSATISKCDEPDNSVGRDSSHVGARPAGGNGDEGTASDNESRPTASTILVPQKRPAPSAGDSMRPVQVLRVDNSSVSSLPVHAPVPLLAPATHLELAATHTAALPIERSSLNADQQVSARTILGGMNSFLTGSSGVGKSYVLRFVIQEFERMYPGGVAVTASTSIAALQIGGTSIHSFAGIGHVGGTGFQLAVKANNDPDAVKRWCACRVLIIDEVSLLDSALFDTIDLVARVVRDRMRAAFGGIQVLLCGDFFQLPPISLGRSQSGAGFAFESNAWRACALRTIELRTCVRQAGDNAFIALLNEVRLGTLSERTRGELAVCHVDQKSFSDDSIVPTRLYCRNSNIDEQNAAELEQLPATAHVFHTVDAFHGAPNASTRARLLETAAKGAPDTITLKVGAQVVFTQNMPQLGLVNGSRGVVRGFKDVAGSGSCAIVEFTSGQSVVVRPFSLLLQGGGGVVMLRTALPLKLAWALAVHKSQGMSLSRAVLIMNDTFDFGQLYTAVSRVVSLAGLWINGDLPQAVVKVHHKVAAFYRALEVGAL